MGAFLLVTIHHTHIGGFTMKRLAYTTRDLDTLTPQEKKDLYHTKNQQADEQRLKALSKRPSYRAFIRKMTDR